MIKIRPENTTDINAIETLNHEAFGNEGNEIVKLITLMRDRNELLFSLVATKNAQIVGHVCASSVTVDGNDFCIAGIAPLAVSELHRHRGIGSMLMEEIIVQLRDSGCTAAVLLGSPHYYQRFGFKTASHFNLQNEYGANDAFMAMELRPDALKHLSGMVKYASSFAECGA